MSRYYIRNILNTDNTTFLRNGVINTPQYTTENRDLLNAEYGQMLYNSTTNTINFYSNTGLWSEIGSGGSIPTNNLTIGNLNFNNNTITSSNGDMILYPTYIVDEIGSTIVCKANNLNLGTGASGIIDRNAFINNLTGGLYLYSKYEMEFFAGSRVELISTTTLDIESRNGNMGILSNANILFTSTGTINFNIGTTMSLTSNGKITISTNNGSSNLEIIGTLDMKTYNIINVGTINTLALPTSAFVGINDSQTLTNKTINGSQLVNNSVSLAKMSTLTANSIIGNNTGVSATPIALSVTNVKIMLGLDNNFTIGNLNFNNNTISSATGDIILYPNSAVVKITGALNMQTNNIINVGTINTLALPTSTFVGIDDSQVLTNKTINGSQLVNNSVSLDKMSTLTANTIIGNNTGVSATPIALSVTNVKTMLGLDNNFTIGNLNFNNNTISSVTGDIILYPNSAVVKITGALNMQTNNIINVGTINTLALPTSTFVGIDDSQVLTNKTINGSQLVNNSVSLAKMSTLTANTIIGNNTGVSATPIALTIDEVKNMIGVVSSTVTLTGDVTGSGTGSFATTIAAGSVTLAKMANFAANSIIGNNTGVSATPIALTANDVRTMLGLTTGTITLTGDVTGSGVSSFATTIAAGSVTLAKMANFAANSIMGNNTGTNSAPIALTATQTKTLLALNNVQNTALSTWTGSTSITTIGTLSSLTVGTMTFSSSGITSTGIIPITPNGGLSTVEIWGPLDMKTNSIQNIGSINTYAMPTSAFVGINDFQTITNKTINASQLINGTVTLAKMSTLAASSIIGNDGGAAATPLALSTSAVKTMLSINNVDNIKITTWTGPAAITSMVNFTVNSGATDSIISLNGTTTTGTRYLSFNQNLAPRATLGIVASNYWFVYDSAFATDMFRLAFGAGNCARFPTYTTNGTLTTTSSNGTLAVSSDRRLKKDEEVLNTAVSLQKIMNLQPKKYVWKNDEDRTNIGFIAQDVEAVIPEAIDGKKYEYEFIRDGASQGVDGTIRVDEEGNPVLDYDRPRYRGLDQCAILSTLVSAVQELTNRVIALEAQL